MKAFSGNITKEMAIGFAKEHRLADEYLKGTFNNVGAKFQACSVGCTIESINRATNSNYNHSDHAAVADALRIPEFVVHLQDLLFEKLPDDLHIEWTERLFQAIPDGADLTPVLPRFLLAIQERSLARLDKTKSPEAYSAVSDVVDMLREWVTTGDRPTDEGVAERAERAARAARAASAESAVWAESAESAEWAARAEGTERAAWAASAVWAARAASAASAEYVWIADTLINAIESCEQG